MFQDCEYCEPCCEELPYQVGETDDGICVYLVDGDCVKREHDADFVEGGNGQEVDWIPDDECWIDWNVRSEQWKFIAAHEITEMRLMRDRGMSYEKAHDIANEVEMQLRSEYSESSKHEEEEGESYDNPKEEKAENKPTGKGGPMTRIMIRSKSY